MIEQVAVQEILIKELSERKLRNAGYSLRAFAQSLKISPAALSEIVRGKRRVSLNQALRIAGKLSLPPQDCENLKQLFKSPQLAEIGSHYQELNADQFSVIADWQHFALLSLAETDDFKSDISWMAKRLGVSQLCVRQSLLRLQRLGMIKFHQRRWQISGQSFSSTDGISDVAVRRSHACDLKLAERSLLEDEIDERDFTSIVMTVDPRKMTKIRQMVREFRNKLCAYAESGAKKEVYKMSIQIFPITRDNLSQTRRKR